MEDLEIRDLVKRLSRPDRSGGHVIEAAAITAEGSDSAGVLAWIREHGGQPEALTQAPTGAGLFGGRGGRGDDAVDTRAPLRYVLPPGAFD